MSEDPNFSIEWHKGFQVGLHSGKHTEQERIISLLPKDLRFWIGNRAYNKLIAHIKGDNA